MAIQFIVEDGTGLSTATSYADTTDLEQYWDNLGYDHSALSDDDKKVLLNKAAKIVDAMHVWEGRRIQSTQALQWPRYNFWYPDGQSVPSNSVPKEILNACYEMAYAENQGTNVQPVNDQQGLLRAERVKVDVIEESKEYFEGSSYDRPQVTAVKDALKPLLGNSAGRYGNMVIKRV